MNNKWANKKENAGKYGKVIEKINEYYAATNEKSRHDNYLNILFIVANSGEFS